MRFIIHRFLTGYFIKENGIARFGHENFQAAMQYPFVEKKSYRQSLRIAIGYFQAADVDLVTTNFVSLDQRNTKEQMKNKRITSHWWVYRKVVQRDVLRQD